MASTIVLTPSTDKTGATGTAAINTALGNVGSGGSVLLGPGDWYTDADSLRYSFFDKIAD